MKESRKKFIKKAHSHACDLYKSRIEKEFPKLFKEDALVVGKWYKSKIAVFRVTSLAPLKSYGVYSGKWGNEFYTDVTTKYRPVTDKEVEEALIKEAKKRGFKEGVNFNVTKDLWNTSVGGREGFNTVIDKNTYNYSAHSNSFKINCIDGCMSIFTKGKWATIVETITKEQAEKELGKTILN